MASDEATKEAARRLEQTLARLRKDLEYHQLAIITGAGVTLNATAEKSGKPLPRITWKGLLQNGLDYLVRTGCVEELNPRILRAYDALMDKGSDGTLDAATTLRSEMKKVGQFATWLESVFANLSQEVRHPALLDVLKTFHDRRVPLLTTNYDDVLEKYCGLDGIGRSNQDNVLRFQRRDIHGVFHIHGRWSDASEVVLDTKDYYEVTQSAGVQDMLKNFLQTKTVLFVGCGSGLEDPNFDALLRWASEQQKDISNRHCLLIRDDDSTKYQPLISLKYGPRHEDLAVFLRRLLDNETIQSVVTSIGLNSTILPDPLTVFPFASSTGGHENLQIGNLNWNSQQYSSSESREEHRAATRVWTYSEDGSYNIAEAAIPDFYESFRAREKAPLLPITEYTLVAYPDTVDLCQGYVLSANCPSILSIEDAKESLNNEKKRHWIHLQDNPKGTKRRAQNRINKYVSEWKKYFYLETAEDYHILAHEVHYRRKGLRPQREGRPLRPECVS